ncbi:MAG: hypothetical protein ACI89U_001739 [Gammaproteobacteria bacterium]|jgi:hypothetical protein
MDWEIITAVAETVGAFAVVASLIYLGVQTRNSATEDQARTIHDCSVAFSVWQNSLALDPMATKIWLNGHKDYSGLDEGEALQFMLFFGAVCRILENAFLQYKAGRMEADIWETYRATMRSHANSTGSIQYIETRHTSHTKEFITMWQELQQDDPAWSFYTPLEFT